MLDPNSLKKGVIYKHDRAPVQVLNFLHTHKGRGSATVTVKVRDLITGSVQTLTYKAGDKLEEADISRKQADFLYSDVNTVNFMDINTYEQVSISKQNIADTLKFLKEGQKVTVIIFEGKPIDIELPPKVDLKVVETEPGTKGDTVSGTAYKPAKLETGHTVQVPLFINQGDVVRVNTETGEYVERAN